MWLVLKQFLFVVLLKVVICFLFLLTGGLHDAVIIAFAFALDTVLLAWFSVILFTFTQVEFVDFFFELFELLFVSYFVNVSLVLEPLALGWRQGSPKSANFFHDL